LAVIGWQKSNTELRVVRVLLLRDWCELAMVETGEVYEEEISVPRTEPWGTPTEHGLVGDE